MGRAAAPRDSPVPTSPISDLLEGTLCPLCPPGVSRQLSRRKELRAQRSSQSWAEQGQAGSSQATCPFSQVTPQPVLCVYHGLHCLASSRG